MIIDDLHLQIFQMENTGDQRLESMILFQSDFHFKRIQNMKFSMQELCLFDRHVITHLTYNFH